MMDSSVQRPASPWKRGREWDLGPPLHHLQSDEQDPRDSHHHHGERDDDCQNAYGRLGAREHCGAQGAHCGTVMTKDR